MPTAYSSLLGLALPVTGELSGTWGATVNDYITSYLDSAVAGTQTISGSQTAVTLSVANGVALSQAGSGATGSSQYAIINCTGNPASLLTITAPALSKPYIVINATSTSQSVKVVGAGPTTGVTMVSGEKAVIAWNGSDFVKVASTVSNLASVTGTLGIANGGTGQTTIPAKSVFVANALDTLTTVTPAAGQSIRINAGNTAWEAYTPSTGTGDAVLANNNAFTGANTFYNSTGQTFGTATSTQDGIIVGGRAGGSASYRITLAPTTLASNTTLTLPNVTDTVATIGTAQTFTAAQTFRAANAIRSEAASTQDAIVIAGRAGGTSSYAVTLTPTTLTASRTVTIPNETFTVGFRNIPAVGTQTGSYSLGTGDVGKYVQVSTGGSITVPNNTFAEGDVITIFNNTTGNITMTMSITTAYIAGTNADKDSLTLATRGVATILFISGTVCVVSGNVS